MTREGDFLVCSTSNAVLTERRAESNAKEQTSQRPLRVNLAAQSTDLAAHEQPREHLVKEDDPDAVQETQSARRARLLQRAVVELRELQ